MALILLLAASLTPYLDDAGLSRVQELLHVKKSETNLECAEMEYARAVGRQTLNDVLLVYDPKHRARLQISYPEFSAEGEKAGADLGYGLHVLKRLRLDDKVIDVNEHWAQDAATGGLFAPDEIRIKTLAYEGERHVPGSHELYLFDVIRLAWGPGAKAAKVCRRTRYRFDDETGFNRGKAMRVPVSSPYSCTGCHLPDNVFAKRFIQPGETRDFEAIVGDGYMRLPLAETFGMKSYLEKLRAQHRPASLQAAIQGALLRPRERLMPDAIPAAIRRALADENESCWLDADTQVDDDWLGHQGTYVKKGKGTFLDAIEWVIPGKYETWLPTPLLR